MKKIVMLLIVGSLVLCGSGCQAKVSDEPVSDTSVVVLKDSAKVDTVKKDTAKIDTAKAKKVLVKPSKKAPASRKKHTKVVKDTSKIVKK